MMERLEFGRNYDDEEEDLDTQEKLEEEEVEDSDDYLDQVDHAAEANGFDEHREPVEHQLEHAVDDRPHTNFDEGIDWRKAVRRQTRGSFEPPDVREYRWPAFVRVSKLPPEGGS